MGDTVTVSPVVIPRQPENKNNVNENNQENAPVYQQFVPPPQEREEFYPRSDF